jgi:hypothetical protein
MEPIPHNLDYQLGNRLLPIAEEARTTLHHSMGKHSTDQAAPDKFRRAGSMHDHIGHYSLFQPEDAGKEFLDKIDFLASRL